MENLRSLLLELNEVFAAEENKCDEVKDLHYDIKWEMLL